MKHLPSFEIKRGQNTDMEHKIFKIPPRFDAEDQIYDTSQLMMTKLGQ